MALGGRLCPSLWHYSAHKKPGFTPGLHTLTDRPRDKTQYLSKLRSNMKVLVVLALAVFTGCNANVLWQDPAKLDLVKDAFWEYVAKATLTAEDALQKIKQSELGQEFNTRISESAAAVNQYSLALKGQVTPLTEDLLAKLTQESELLKGRLEQDVTTMRAQLQPYAVELSTDIQRQVEELRKEVAAYAEGVDSDTLKASLLQKSEELKGSLEKSVTDLQSLLVPQTDSLKQKMEQNLEAFQQSIAPLTQDFQTQLAKKTQEIQQSLAPYGAQLEKLEVNAQDLKVQLTSLWESFIKGSQ